MASIQQSLNQLVAAGLGASVAGKHFYQQTPGYQAKQLDKRADTLEDIAAETDALGEEYELSRDLRVEAARLSPTRKRVERAYNIYQERGEENSINRVQQKTEAIQNQNNAFLDRVALLKYFKEQGMRAKGRNLIDSEIRHLEKQQQKSSSRKETNE